MQMSLWNNFEFFMYVRNICKKKIFFNFKISLCKKGDFSSVIVLSKIKIHYSKCSKVQSNRWKHVDCWKNLSVCCALTRNFFMSLMFTWYAMFIHCINLELCYVSAQIHICHKDV